MQHFGKAALRVTKNYTKGYSDTQAKVRDATSNDPWGPSGTQMNEIAQMTYNQLSLPPISKQVLLLITTSSN
jgi:epsin